MWSAFDSLRYALPREYTLICTGNTVLVHLIMLRAQTDLQDITEIKKQVCVV